jgi:hypothetical protein
MKIQTNIFDDFYRKGREGRKGEYNSHSQEGETHG